MLGGTQARKKTRRVSYLLREEEGRFPSTRAAPACLRLHSRRDLLRWLSRPLRGEGRDDAAAGPEGRRRRRACAERRAWRLALVRWAGIGLA